MRHVLPPSVRPGVPVIRANYTPEIRSQTTSGSTLGGGAAPRAGGASAARAVWTPRRCLRVVGTHGKRVSGQRVLPRDSKGAHLWSCSGTRGFSRSVTAPPQGTRTSGPPTTVPSAAPCCRYIPGINEQESQVLWVPE